MDPKPSPPPPADGATSRRQGAKRKAREAAGTPPPPKLLAREEPNPSDQPALPPPLPPRARKAASSNKAPRRRKAASSNKAPRRAVKPQRESEAPPPPPPLPLPPPRPSLEEEVEAVLSRGDGVHVVPTFAGWFSWMDIHPIEKQTLARFFDGKSERRTPEIYLGIRNFIMRKFHFNPKQHLQSQDLSELSIGEMDTRLEVLDFLAYWGLVNFHPFAPHGQECKVIASKSSADTEERTSLVEKLFQFETVQSYLVPASNKAEIVSPAQVTHLFSEPTLAEDAVTAAEPSVEYHCNSCSVDCSRKRYHCRTQADFDLCSDCYNEGKFDEGMSRLDFILMDSAEVPGSGGDSWTDQETLLLLEAIEIFKGRDWDGIAEHVATKSKAQCMLYFLQMPIQESLLDDDFSNQTSQKVTEKDSAENVTELPEKTEISKKKIANSEERGVNLTDNNVSAKKDTEISGDNDVVAASIFDELYKSSVTDPSNKKNSCDVNVTGEHASNFVTDVLRYAFEAVGHLPEEEDTGLFTEVGNPVMALAAFLSGIVEHDDAIASCRSSLRALSEISPALLLATRHCFILPDPPNEHEISTASGSPTSMADMHQNGDDATPNASYTDKDNSKKLQGTITKEKQNAAFNKNQELSNTKESHVDVPQADTETHKTKDFDNPVSMVENCGASNEMRDGSNIISQSAAPQDTNTNEPSCISSQEANAANTEDSKGRNRNDNIAPAAADSIRRLQRAACTAISAAAVKAKLLADQEECYIWQLVDLVIQKQFQKLEAKMSLIADVEHMVSRAKEVTHENWKRLMMQQNAIRLEMQRDAIIAYQRAAAMQSRLNQHEAPPGTRPPVGYPSAQHAAGR